MPNYHLDFEDGSTTSIECYFSSNDRARDGSMKELEQRIGNSGLPGSVKVARLDTGSDIDKWIGAWDCGGPGSDYEWRDANRWPPSFSPTLTRRSRRTA